MRRNPRLKADAIRVRLGLIVGIFQRGTEGINLVFFNMRVKRVLCCANDWWLRPGRPWHLRRRKFAKGVELAVITNESQWTHLGDNLSHLHVCCADDWWLRRGLQGHLRCRKVAEGTEPQWTHLGDNLPHLHLKSVHQNLGGMLARNVLDETRGPTSLGVLLVLEQ